MYSGFPLELLSTVLCPCDGGRLTRPSSRNEPAFETELTCQSCGARYPITEGILSMFPQQSKLDSLTKDEQQARDQDAHHYDRHFTKDEQLMEASTIIRNADLVEGKRVLDLGCGTGRITAEFINGGARVVACDLSLASLRVLAQQLPAGAEVGLVWGDAVQLRFVPASFDIVVSTQVVEHISTVERRALFYRGACSALDRMGTLLMTVYYYCALRRILGKSQEGLHGTGVFYHRFTASEIRRDLSGLFRIQDIRPMQVNLMLSRLVPSMRYDCPKLLENPFLARLLGHLAFVKAEKYFDGN